MDPSNQTELQKYILTSDTIVLQMKIICMKAIQNIWHLCPCNFWRLIMKYVGVMIIFFYFVVRQLHSLPNIKHADDVLIGEAAICCGIRWKFTNILWTTINNCLMSRIMQESSHIRRQSHYIYTAQNN